MSPLPGGRGFPGFISSMVQTHPHVTLAESSYFAKSFSWRQRGPLRLAAMTLGHTTRHWIRLCLSLPMDGPGVGCQACVSRPKALPEFMTPTLWRRVRGSGRAEGGAAMRPSSMKQPPNDAWIVPRPFGHMDASLRLEPKSPAYSSASCGHIDGSPLVCPLMSGPRGWPPVHARSIYARHSRMRVRERALADKQMIGCRGAHSSHAWRTGPAV